MHAPLSQRFPTQRQRTARASLLTSPLPRPYQADVGREREAFKTSSDIIKSQQGTIDSKTWWLVRDNLRGQAYNLKSNMKALTAVASDKGAAQKAYEKVLNELNAFVSRTPQHPSAPPPTPPGVGPTRRAPRARAP